MEFYFGDIVKVFHKYHFVIEKQYDDWWKEYRYKTLECGFENNTEFVLTMKESTITPGSDGHKKAQPGKQKLFDYIFTKCEKIIGQI